MNVIYITFVDLDNVSSGSSVRPKKIYDAFLNEGHSIDVLSGLQNRKIDRWKNCLKFFKKIRNKRYDLCYIEPPAGPFFNFCDHLLLLYISKVKKVPTGLFYRDAYWKFGDWYNINRAKKMILKVMHKFDWFVFKYACKIIYFPSQTMADLFECKNKKPLPPGSSIMNNESSKYNGYNNCIYVGGVSERYGTEILLEAFKKVNDEYNKNITLTLICREEIDIIKRYKSEPWLYVQTGISGDEKLREFYKKADLALIPFKRDIYMDFAIPIKMFEYMANNMPIIATNCTEVEKFINENNIGIITDDNSDALAKGIIDFYDMSNENRMRIYKNIQSAIANNTWEKRVEKIIRLAES